VQVTVSHPARLPTRLPVAGEGVRLARETEIEVYTVGEIGLLETLQRDPQGPTLPSQNKCSPNGFRSAVTRGEPSPPRKTQDPALPVCWFKFGPTSGDKYNLHYLQAQKGWKRMFPLPPRVSTTIRPAALLHPLVYCGMKLLSAFS
jgi:hypothetical protein